VVEAGFHQRAIRLVAAGSVDAAAIDSQVLAIELPDHPRLADDLRVVGAFGPSTIQPVVAASRLPDGWKRDVRELLVCLADDPTARPALDHGLIEGFAAVDDGAYDDIRACSPPSRPPGGPASPRRCKRIASCAAERHAHGNRPAPGRTRNHRTFASPVPVT
jgi:hypothetical protein